MGKGIIFLVIDIVSFFDKEDIFDCLETMEEINVNKKAVRVWYMMNKATKITVQTPCGMILSLREWFPSIQFDTDNLRAGCVHL